MTERIALPGVVKKIEQSSLEEKPFDVGVMTDLEMKVLESVAVGKKELANKFAATLWLFQFDIPFEEAEKAVSYLHSTANEDYTVEERRAQARAYYSVLNFNSSRVDFEPKEAADVLMEYRLAEPGDEKTQTKFLARTYEIIYGLPEGSLSEVAQARSDAYNRLDDLWTATEQDERELIREEVKIGIRKYYFYLKKGIAPLQ